MSHPVTLRVPDDLHAQVKDIHKHRQDRVPHRPLPLSEVYVDLLAAAVKAENADPEEGE